MYAVRGDPAAFMEVKRHFEEVFPVIAKHRGAVVKTIGDAIMAAFSDPLDAVKACADIHAVFHADREDSKTRLRISLNTGPCIAVKLNTGVDYFGQTVNLAAKLQSLAEAGEVALSASVWNARGVQAWFEGRALEEVAYESKALTAPMPVKRWSCFAPSKS
jgi:class 3 adenylate cyclase